MKALIVGMGALGGTIAARLLPHASLALAARDDEAAAALRATGLQVTGCAEARVDEVPVRGLEEWRDSTFDLIVIATKADDALAVAPRCCAMLAPGGVVLPIQNGAVAQVLAQRHGDVILGGLSNLGATMHAPGRYEQRNRGHLLLGELAGGTSARSDRIAAFLGAGVDVRLTANMTGAIWSKLLINCAVTSLGAVAGTTMRGFIERGDGERGVGRALFDATYDEALAVAVASGVRPEPMLVDPMPPPRGVARAPWIAQLLAAYGDLQPSMLQDFQRRRPTEIEFINGYVARLGPTIEVATPYNAAIADLARAISAGVAVPSLDHLAALLHGEASP